ncbi:Nucleic acid-binding protein [Corchorus capsularis]|uniref:Nucleic acid-binding protein n=1 Tax=Corchorus capsularis TaxID=210143 RepID=A0A1R3HZ40_COCAP|nr:Nucleic acid-binding protein [Corchorus capsularis]
MKFRVRTVIKNIDTSVHWCYAACGVCKQALSDGFDGLFCPRHQIQTPENTLKMPLVVRDHTARMKVMIFGELAEKMTGIKAGNVPMLKNEEPIMKLPDQAFDILGNEYSMVVGLSQQAQEKEELNYKIFDFTFLQGTPPAGAENTRKAQSQATSKPGVQGDEPHLEEGVQQVDDSLGEGVEFLALRTPKKKTSTCDLGTSQLSQTSKTVTPEK